MKNAIVLGSGRSGTSLLTGMLSHAGYLMGSNLYEGDSRNPKGYFESWEINKVNEDIIGKIVPSRAPILGNLIHRGRVKHGHRWLATVPLDSPIVGNESTNARIQQLVSLPPYCYKDPRFSYTLPVWQPFLQNVVFLCVFRHPAVTVQSMLEYVRNNPSMQDFDLSEEHAFKVWELMYSHILQKHARSGDWLFVHYEQLLAGDAHDRLERLLDIKLSTDFPDRSLCRSKAKSKGTENAIRIYDRLCAQASFDCMNAV